MIFKSGFDRKTNQFTTNSIKLFRKNWNEITQFCSPLNFSNKQAYYIKLERKVASNTKKKKKHLSFTVSEIEKEKLDDLRKSFKTSYSGVIEILLNVFEMDEKYLRGLLKREEELKRNMKSLKEIKEKLVKVSTWLDGKEEKNEKEPLELCRP